MKKIFTLALALGTLSSVFAQSNRYDRRDDRWDGYSKVDNNRNDRDYRNNDYTLTKSERDKLVKQINKDYDNQIKAVKKSRSLKSYEKDRQIRMLEAQRDQKIRETNARYADRNNRRYNDQAYNRRW